MEFQDKPIKGVLRRFLGLPEEIPLAPLKDIPGSALAKIPLKILPKFLKELW